ncbi:MAG: hypothetical protein ACRD2D_04870 [Terriglobales bacterium]
MITNDELEQTRAKRRQELEGAESAAQLTREAGLVSAEDLESWRPDGVREAEVALEAGELIELALWPEGLRFTVPEWLELVYVLAGDRHPGPDVERDVHRGRLSRLAAEVFGLLREAQAAMPASELQARLGAQRVSLLATERAVGELARGLRALRVGRHGGESVWRATVAAYPQLPKKKDAIAAMEAAAGVISLRLQRQVCDTEAGLAEYFAPVISNARVHAALQGLAVAGAIELEAIEGRKGWRMKKATSKEQRATSS